MTPAPAAAARNTNTVVEGKIIMTDEELQKAIQEVDESLDNLSKTDEPLTKQQARSRKILLLKKETLYHIKEAKATDNKKEEVYHTVHYNLLTRWGEKHPFLIGLVISNLRWNPFW